MLNLAGPVTLKYPASDPATAAIAGDLAARHAEITAEPHEAQDLALLDTYGRPTGIRFRGAPVGQERAALEAAIVAVSRGSTGLSPLARSQARDLSGELWILTTPS